MKDIVIEFIEGSKTSYDEWDSVSKCSFGDYIRNDLYGLIDWFRSNDTLTEDQIENYKNIFFKELKRRGY